MNTFKVKPWLWWFSNAVVLGGSLMYARVRQLEMATQHRTESKVEEKEETEPLQKVATELFVHYMMSFQV